MDQERPDRWKASVDRIWEATRRKLQIAGFRAGQYKELAQKKYDLGILQRNISSLHAEIGKIVDDSRPAGDTDILARDDVRSILRRLDSYKTAAAELQAEIEKIKARVPPEAAAEE